MPKKAFTNAGQLKIKYRCAVTLTSTYFVKQPQFRFKLSSVFIFVASAFAAWEINIFGQIAFPSQNPIPYFVRTAITLVTDLALINVSHRLLVQNNLPKKALGLTVSTKTISDLFWGSLVGAITVAIIAGLLFIYVPYHFVPGPAALQVWKSGISYLAGNTLEELMFRGFLFILFSQLAGWRISALIMALPFGLFHLQGTGLTMNGLKIFSTTALYSFVFSFSYVLFRSLWACIGAHVVSNIFLHTITGLDGANQALFMPVFKKSWPEGYDVNFIVGIASAILVAGSLWILIVLFDKKHNSMYKSSVERRPSAGI